MKRFLLAASAAMLLLGSAADAADLNVSGLYKAPPPSVTAGGIYWGVGSTAGVASASVSNNAFPGLSTNLNATGGSVGGEIGWIGNVGGHWARGAIDIDYQNITAGASSGGASASLASRWSVTERFDVNFELVQTLFSLTNINPTGLVPSIAPIAPPGFDVGAPTQYLGGFARQEGLDGTVGSVKGQTWLNLLGLETGWIWPTLDMKTGKPNGGAVDLVGQIGWANKGLVVNQVFATAGPPMVVQGATGINTQYDISLHVLVPALFR